MGDFGPTGAPNQLGLQQTGGTTQTGNVPPPVNAPPLRAAPPASGVQLPIMPSTGTPGAPALSNAQRLPGTPQTGSVPPPAVAPSLRAAPQPLNFAPPQLSNVPLPPGPTSNKPNGPPGNDKSKGYHVPFNKSDADSLANDPFAKIGRNWGGGNGILENKVESNRIQAEWAKDKVVSEQRRAALQRSAELATKAAIEKDKQDDQRWNRRSRS